jgi:hypothetical protein
MVGREVIKSACWSLWPVPLLVYAYWNWWDLGNNIPFLNGPSVRLIALGAIVWLLLGFFVTRKYSQQWQRLELIKSACWSFWPFLWLLYNDLLAPGLIIPFLNIPIARLIELGAIVWLVLGFFVMHKCSRWWQRLIATLIFPVPAALLPLLGPVIITIINLLGPTLQNK